MFDDDDKPIRYHLTEDFELEPGEPVFLDRMMTGTSDWERTIEVPEDRKTPQALEQFLRATALAERRRRLAGDYGTRRIAPHLFGL